MDCNVCTDIKHIKEPLYEPPGLQTRLTIKGNEIEMLDIHLNQRRYVEINFCPKCGRTLKRGN